MVTRLLHRYFTSIVVAGFLALPIGAATSAQDGAAGDVPAPPTAGMPLTLETLEIWHNFIQPDGDEVRWQDIPWRASLWQAVVDAQAQRRPVLLWTMNGHPMGCT